MRFPNPFKRFQGTGLLRRLRRRRTRQVNVKFVFWDDDDERQEATAKLQLSSTSSGLHLMRAAETAFADRTPDDGFILFRAQKANSEGQRLIMADTKLTPFVGPGDDALTVTCWTHWTYVYHQLRALCEEEGYDMNAIYDMDITVQEKPGLQKHPKLLFQPRVPKCHRVRVYDEHGDIVGTRLPRAISFELVSRKKVPQVVVKSYDAPRAPFVTHKRPMALQFFQLALLSIHCVRGSYNMFYSNCQTFAWQMLNECGCGSFAEKYRPFSRRQVYSEERRQLRSTRPCRGKRPNCIALSDVSGG